MTSRTPPLFSNRMFRCAFLAVIAGILVTAGLVRADHSEQPNVVLIISDDQAYGDFGFMGNDLVQTPHLDRLAAQSARYPRGYVSMSVCRPSLATLLTGLAGWPAWLVLVLVDALLVVLALLAQAAYLNTC